MAKLPDCLDAFDKQLLVLTEGQRSPGISKSDPHPKSMNSPRITHADASTTSVRLTRAQSAATTSNAHSTEPNHVLEQNEAFINTRKRNAKQKDKMKCQAVPVHVPDSVPMFDSESPESCTDPSQLFSDEQNINLIKEVCKWTELTHEEFLNILYWTSGSVQDALQMLLYGKTMQGHGFWTEADDKILSTKARSNPAYKQLITKFGEESVIKRITYLGTFENNKKS